MVDPLQPDKVICHCSECGKEYRLARGHLGKRAQCKGCLQKFIITEALPAASVETSQPMSPPPEGCILCTVCQQPIAPEEAAKDCPACQTPYHHECWEYNQGCGIYGCEQAPETETLKNVEIPVSYWGKEEKNCPSCGNEIHAAALRCVNCGAMFASAEPEDRRAYRERRSKGERLPKVGRTSIVLLVLSILSCTAPLVAVFGTMWYFSNRKDIQALSGTQSAMCRIALGLAYLQTLVIVVVCVFYNSP